MRWTLVLSLLPLALQAGELAGVVTDASSGDGVPGATVRIDSLGVGAIANAEGEFLLERLPGGSHRVRVTTVGYADWEQLVMVPVEGGRHVQATLTPVAIPGRPVDVHAQRGVDLDREPSFVTVLDRSWFEGRATSVSEVLASSVGVKVRSLGGLGSFSTVSVRGSTSEQVTVYVDGIPLNAAVGGGVDLSTLPLSHVESIEVHRGTSAGGSAMGGTVYIRTIEADSLSGQSAALSYGSFDTRGASAVVRLARPGSRFLVIADYASSDSDFTFLDDNGTEYNTDDDEPASRRNNDFTSASLLGKWEGSVLGWGRPYVSGSAYWSRKGIPGISNNQSVEARINQFRILAEAGLNGVRAGAARLDNRISFSRRRERFSDPRGEVGVGVQDDTYRTTTVRWEGEATTVIGSRLRPALDVDAGWETFDPTTNLQGSPPQPSARRWAVRAGGRVDMAMPRGVVTAWSGVDRLWSRVEAGGVRGLVDSSRTDLLLNAGVGIRLDITEGLWLKANVGRSHRAPSFYELFGDRGGVIGNTDLQKESGVTWDAGFRYERGGSVVLEAVYYDHHYRDLIQYAQVSQGTSRPFNIGSATVRGIELTAHGTPIEKLQMSANYTLQLSTDGSEVPHWSGNRLPGRPVHEFDARLDLGGRRANGFYTYTFEAGTFLDRANFRPVASRHIHGAGIRFSPVKSLTITIEAKNVLDNRVSDIWGYPLPGRALSVQLKESF